MHSLVRGLVPRERLRLAGVLGRRDEPGAVRGVVDRLSPILPADEVVLVMRFSEDLDEASIKKILDAFRRGEVPKPGPQVDRQTSAPIGGPTTLKGE